MEFERAVDLKDLSILHTKAREETLKKIEQHKKDCELDFIDILNAEDQRIKNFNRDKRDKMTHG